MVQARNIVFLILTCVVLGLFGTSCIGIGWGKLNADIQGENVNGKLLALFYFEIDWNRIIDEINFSCF